MNENKRTNPDLIYDDLKQKIETGELGDDAILPSETTLATQFNASRGTVRKALDRLAEEDLIKKVQGAGTRVLPAKRICIAWQSITLGPVIRSEASLRHILALISEAGYEGIEFAQRPDKLGLGENPTIAELLAVLKEYGLKLVGLAGGDVPERAEFLSSSSSPRREPYLYIDDWKESYVDYLNEGFTLAMHAHFNMRIQSSRDAATIFSQVDSPNLKWLPDTAHLFIAGEDPVKALDVVKMDKLAAVHIKDWSPCYGATSLRYVNGWTEIGSGEVPIQAVLDRLLEMNYRGWLVVEQDSTRNPLASSIEQNFDQLSARLGRATPLPRQRPAGSRDITRSGSETDPRKRAVDEVVAGLAREFSQAAGSDLPICYQGIVDAIYEMLDCRLVTLWSYDSLFQNVTLLASSDSEIRLSPSQTRYPTENTLNGIAVERHDVSSFDVGDPDAGLAHGRPWAQFNWPHIVLSKGLRVMKAVPIPLASNPNHIRLIVDIFPTDDMCVTRLSAARPDAIEIPDEDLYGVVMDIARAADRGLESACSRAAAATSFNATAPTSARECLDQLVQRIRRLVNCQGATLFGLDPDGKLRPWSTTGIEWAEGAEPWYEPGEGRTGGAFVKNRPVLLPLVDRGAHPIGKSWEIVADNKSIYETLLVPFTRFRGSPIAILRCRNRTGKAPNDLAFTEDDVAIVEAISQAAMPTLEYIAHWARVRNIIEDTPLSRWQ